MTITNPRVFRHGDPEPTDVQAVMDSHRDVYIREPAAQWDDRDSWVNRALGHFDWPDLLAEEAPLVEVHLPDYDEALAADEQRQSRVRN